VAFSSRYVRKSPRVRDLRMVLRGVEPETGVHHRMVVVSEQLRFVRRGVRDETGTK
jgi:hypothetical protein